MCCRRCGFRTLVPEVATVEFTVVNLFSAYSPTENDASQVKTVEYDVQPLNV
jgi:hypothetical protein